MQIRSYVLAFMVVLAAVATVTSVAAQTAPDDGSQWMVPHTADGHPDLQGVWANNAATPLERPESLGDRAFLTDEEVAALQARAGELFNGETDAAFGGSVFEAVLNDAKDFTSSDAGTGNYNQFWLVDRNFDNRTSLIVDPPSGRLPALTDDGAARAGARRGGRQAADTYTDRSNSDRCLTYGVPRIRAGYNSYFQIFQSATHVAILQEMIHEVRVIPLSDHSHLPPALRQYNGDSRAHYEGDTLVVETTNFSPHSGVENATEHVRLVERFTRVGPDRLDWELTYEDDNTWSAPWTAKLVLQRTDDAIFEYACHEGNYAMEGILAGRRAEDRAMTTETAQAR